METTKQKFQLMQKIYETQCKLIKALEKLNKL